MWRPAPAAEGGDAGSGILGGRPAGILLLRFCAGGEEGKCSAETMAMQSHLSKQVKTSHPICTNLTPKLFHISTATTPPIATN